MISYSLIIEKINNGFLLSWKEDWTDEKTGIPDIKIKKEVIEEEYPPQNYLWKKEIKNMDEEQYTMKKLLERIADYFGYSYNKFSKNNLRITFDREGHKI